MFPHRDPLHRMNREDHEIGPFKILGAALAAGLQSKGNLTLAFGTTNSNTLDTRRPARWDK